MSAPELTEYPGAPGCTILRFPTEEAWLAARRNYITASDAATLFIDEIDEQGESTYGTPYTIALEKLGKLDTYFDDEARRRMWFSTRMENVAGEYWREKDPCLPTFRFSGFHLIVNEKYPNLAATLDFMFLKDKGVAGPLEVKAPGEYMLRDWKDGETPLKFAIQNNVQMGLTNSVIGAIFGVIGGNTPRYTFTEFDPDLMALTQERAAAFMGDLAKGIIPPPDGRQRTTEAIKRLHPKDNGSEVILPPEAAEWVDTAEVAAERIKEWEETKTAAENALRVAMGDASYGRGPGVTVSWKWQGGKPTKLEVPMEAQAALVDLGVPIEIKTSPEFRRLNKRKDKA